jgi:hypothetical protein
MGRREMGGSRVWMWFIVGMGMGIDGSAGGAGSAGLEREGDCGWLVVDFDGLFLERFFGGAIGEKRHILRW